MFQMEPPTNARLLEMNQRLKIEVCGIHSELVGSGYERRFIESTRGVNVLVKKCEEVKIIEKSRFRVNGALAWREQAHRNGLASSPSSTTSATYK